MFQKLRNQCMHKNIKLQFFQRGAEKRAVQYNMFFFRENWIGGPYHFSRLKKKSFDRKKMQLRAF